MVVPLTAEFQGLRVFCKRSQLESPYSMLAFFKKVKRFFKSIFYFFRSIFKKPRKLDFFVFTPFFCFFFFRTKNDSEKNFYSIRFYKFTQKYRFVRLYLHLKAIHKTNLYHRIKL